MSQKESLAGYCIERALKADTSYLAISPAGRRVVLKMLEGDCLLGSQLHPLIKDRLGRVRELAHLGVANLYGAERHDQRAFLVWEYVEGMTLEEYLGAGRIEPKAVASLAYQLVLSLESLHGLGIIHGALHARNIIVTPAGPPRLTHISPLLYNDPRGDIERLMGILREMGCSAALENLPASPALRELAARLAAPSPEGMGEDVERIGALPSASARVASEIVVVKEERRWQRWALLGAAAAALIGALVAWGIWRMAAEQAPERAEGRVAISHGST